MSDLFAVLEATWPPAATSGHGPWRLRQGNGGGKRVSAAVATAPVSVPDLADLIAAQAAQGQAPLVQVLPGQDDLDTLLQAEGWQAEDETCLYAAPVAALAAPLPPVTAFPHWPRLAMVEDLWAAAGIGPARLAVMDRAAGPKAAILARVEDRPAGAAFVALAGDTAMVHAVEVAPRFRRRGAARHLMRAAATWAAGAGAGTLALAVTRRNAAARALYASLGMAHVDNYHYRSPAPMDPPPT